MTRKLLRGALPAAAALIVLALPAGSLYYEYNAGASCARCHEIRTHYDAWHASSHRDVTCGACHGEITTLDAGVHWGNLRRLVQHVLHQAPQISPMKTRIERGDFTVAGAARHVPMAGSVPRIVVGADLVAARAGGAGVVFVIEASRRQRQHDQGGSGRQRATQQLARHSPRPFRLRVIRRAPSWISRCAPPRSTRSP